MRRIFTLVLAGISCLSLVGMGRGAEAPLTNYIDDKVIFAGEIDTKKVDFDVIEKWLVETMKAGEVLPTADQPQAEKDLHSGMEEARKWLAEFQKAGGSSLYAVMNGSFQNGNPMAVIAPLGPEGNNKAIMSLFLNGTPNGPTTLPVVKGQQQWERYRPRPEMIEGKGVVFATPMTLTWMKNLQPRDRVEMTAAMNSVKGKGDGREVFVPTPSFRNFLKQNVPPNWLGQSTTPLTQGIKWISATATMPPSPTGRLVIQANDAATAQAISKILTSALAMGKLFNQGAGVTNPDDVMLALPAVQNDQLILDLDNAKAVKLAHQMATIFKMQRQQTQRVASMNNMRQLVMGCIMYSNDHKGTWPDKLDAIDKYVGMKKDQLLTNPMHPDLKPGFVYVKPANSNNPSRTMVLYESHTKWEGGVNAGFADGHVEYIADKKRFDDLLQTATESAGEKDAGGL